MITLMGKDKLLIVVLIVFSRLLKHFKVIEGMEDKGHLQEKNLLKR